MTLLDALPRTEQGEILLSPAGMIDGVEVEGSVKQEWLAQILPEVATATVPLSAEALERLKNIDSYWAQNATRWRDEGRI
jgi:hypothetical protein